MISDEPMNLNGSGYDVSLGAKHPALGKFFNFSIKTTHIKAYSG